MESGIPLLIYLLPLYYRPKLELNKYFFHRNVPIHRGESSAAETAASTTNLNIANYLHLSSIAYLLVNN